MSNVFDGSCNKALTNTQTIIVSPFPNNPTLSPLRDTFCIGEEMVFNVTGGANEIISYTINNGANQTLSLNATGTGVITISNPDQIVVVDLLNIYFQY